MGEVFAGRYELVDLLGEGGMGTVWRAFDHRAHCYLAAKVLRQSDAASLLRFVREQTFRIEHPHVVTPRGWAGEDDRVLFTMDLLRGGSLATLLGDYGPLPPQWVAVLVDQVLAGLSAVHTAGLVHRDVKPGNVLLEPTGRGKPVAKLTDFGVAVAVDEPRLTSASQLLGTPGYLAPEVVGGATPEPRHDLYAVGVLAAELLSGQRPEPGGGGVVGAVAAAAPVGVPEPLWSLVRRLAAWSPDDRPRSAERARAGLRGLGVLPPPGVVPDDDGADLEVLDVVAELPSGWGPGGPTATGGTDGNPAARRVAEPGLGVGPVEAAAPREPDARPAGGDEPRRGPSQSWVAEPPAAGMGGGRAKAAVAGLGASGGGAGGRPVAAAEPGVGRVDGPESGGRSAGEDEPRRGPGQLWVAEPPAAGMGGGRGALEGADGGSVGGPPVGVRANRWGGRQWVLAVAAVVLVVGGIGSGAWVLANDDLWFRAPVGSTPSPGPSGNSQPTDGRTSPGVGVACDFTEVGQRYTSATQGAVVCRRQADGSYRWVE